MNNRDSEEKCENCKYFVKMELGECRKYAPRGGEGKAWSHVQAFEWCGEFKGKKPPPVGTI